VPHGSCARVTQYLAPVICLLAGLGVGRLLGQISTIQGRQRTVKAILLALAGVGITPVITDAFHPYRAVHAQRAREFAQHFWPGFIRDAEPVCLCWDLDIGVWNSTNLNLAVYLCNQMIYSPHRQHRRQRAMQPVSDVRPLRCVWPLPDDSSEGIVARWLCAMKKRYRLKDNRTVIVDMTAPGATARTELYRLYEFVPQDASPLGAR
jgi:hypothetical protein